MSTTNVLTTSLDFLKLLAHDLRWQMLGELVQSDYRVQELAKRVNRPMNLISYHLKQLRNHGLITERRSSADGRDVYYSVDLPRLNTLYHESGSQLHPALGSPITPPQELPVANMQPRLRVLFLCTHNSARSQMAEGLLRHLGGPGVEVFSAGNQPSVVHPHAIRAMAEIGIDIRMQRSKHLDELRGQSFDMIITVCDRVREQCPIFPGDPECIHWSITDPITSAGTDDYPQFVTIAQELRTRITYLLLTLNKKNSHSARPGQSGHRDQEIRATKSHVLFLCTNNAARSQMAEALMKKYASNRYAVYSAGLAPTAIDPYTIRVMKEIGLDLSEQRSKDVRDYLGHRHFDYVFTVCARNETDCPPALLESGGKQIEWYFEDPVAFDGTDEAKLTKFREIRDKIAQQIRNWLAERGELTLTPSA